MTDYLYLGPDDTRPTLLLAHGAGAPMDSPWMNAFAEALAAAGHRTARFEFAYMAARRSGIRKPPPKAETLMDEFRAAIAGVQHSGRLLIGGKSMGGRVASLVAEAEFRAYAIAGLICLGYPFHPPGQPETLRTAHLATLSVPTLICQGTRDPFGTRGEVPAYALSPAIELFWLEDGDHDFRPRKAASGRTMAENLAAAVQKVADRLV